MALTNPQPAPSTLQLSCLLLDDRGEHRDPSSKRPAQLDISITKLEVQSFKVCDLLLHARNTQRAVCDVGNCAACRRLGRIMVKSAYFLDYPVDQEGAVSTYQEILDLQASAPGKVRFLEAHSPIIEYFPQQRWSNPGTVILECTFDATSSSLKRATEPDASPNKRPHMLVGSSSLPPDPQPGILYIPPAADAIIPINLLPPFFSFPKYCDYQGIIMVDKSLFIPPAMELLGNPGFYSLILPPGTGKTTFMTMIRTWADRKVRNEEAELIFDKLEIAHRLRNPTTQAEAGRGRGKYLCLSFDLTLADLDQPGHGVELASRLEAHLCEIMTHFVENYRNVMGDLQAELEGKASFQMITTILATTTRKRRKILIVIDHWDARIIAWLATLSRNTQIDLNKSIGPVAKFLLQLNHYLKTNKNLEPQVTVLIIGTIPFFKHSLAANPIEFKDLALCDTMNGAFGVTDSELDSMYAIFQTYEPLLLPPQNRRLEFGYFMPRSPQTTDDDDGSGFYSFSLILRHLARTLDLDKGHQSWKFVPLESISQCCEKLLKFSSLRSEREVTVAPFYDTSVESLAMFSKRDDALWKLLYFLGVLRVRTEKQGGDVVWHLRVSSVAARVTLFDRLPPLEDCRLDGSKREEILQNLLEGSHQALTGAMATIFTRVPLLDLGKMKEVVFQVILDTWMYAMDHKGKIPYLDNYFSQLGLELFEQHNESTESAKTSKGPGAKPEASTQARGRTAVASSSNLPSPQPPASSSKVSAQGDYGYADGVVIDMACYPGRVVVIELKYVPLSSLFRVDRQKRKEWKAADKGDRSHLRRMYLEEIVRLESMSLEEVLKLEFSYWETDESHPDGGAYKTITIGACVEDAKIQIIAYMNAILGGRLTHLEYSTRIRVSPSKDPQQVDGVIGFVVLGVGRRAFAIEVEPTFNPEELPNDVMGYKYKARPNWGKGFETHPRNYAKKP